MPNAIINLVNNAMAEIGHVPLSASDFDSGIQTHQSTARRAVQTIMSDMIRKKKDRLYKKTFDITTVASQAQYTLSFDPSYLESTKLRNIFSGSTEDYWLDYLTEEQALQKYTDFDNLTSEGKPLEWWLVTTDNATDKIIRFNPVPDAVYTIRGFRFEEFSEVASTDITNFSQDGDEAISFFVAARVAIRLKMSDSNALLSSYRTAWHKWLAEDQMSDQVNHLVIPYQHMNND